MIQGLDLFFALFKNLAIFIALVALYSYLLGRLVKFPWYTRQIIYGLLFGIFAIGCMYVKIPVFEGVIVDQRNAIVALSGAFGGPLSAYISAVFAGTFRAYLGGGGYIAGIIGVFLAATAGTGMYFFSKRFSSPVRSVINSLVSVIIIMPGFLFVKLDDLKAGFDLMTAMTLPYGSAIFLGILIVGYLLNREENRNKTGLLLRDSEEKYRELVESSEDLIVNINEDGIFTFVNHVSEKILGYPAEQCIGRTGLDFTYPDDIEKTVNWYKECISKKIRQSQFENRLVNLITGQITLVLWSSAFRYSETGEFTGMGSIARDISKIREAEENYKNLFEKMPDGYAVHEIINDAEGHLIDYRFLSINPAFEKITGQKSDELVGKTVLESAKEIKQFWLDIYNKASLSGVPEIFEYFSSEMNKYFEATVYNPGENQLACILTDISRVKKDEIERQEMESELRQFQKMDDIGRLAGGIAHDFNNLLMPIMGYVELGMMGLAPDSKLYSHLEKVREAAERASELTRQILAFSRKQMLEMKVVDINNIVNDFTGLIRHLVREDIRLQIQTESEAYLVNADKGQIEQVLMNLVVNSIDAMPQGGTLSIKTAVVYLDENYIKQHADSFSPGDYIMLEVSDSGSGIDPETRMKIFDPFFTTKSKGKGTGLGLSTAFGIIKQHGGSIWLNSEPGKGSTFKIYLPRSLEPVHIEEELTAKDDLNSGTETILVVEDDNLARELVCKSLSDAGYNVIEAESPAAGIKQASENKKLIHLLLTDVIMPEMNGKELYKKISGILPDIKVLYMSGYTDDIITYHGIPESGINYLQKPFTLQSLKQKVRQVLIS